MQEEKTAQYQEDSSSRAKEAKLRKYNGICLDYSTAPHNRDFWVFQLQNTIISCYKT